MNLALQTATTTTTWIRNRGPALAAKQARMGYWLEEVDRIMRDPEIRAEHPKLKAERIRFYMNPPPGCDASAKPSIHYIKKLVTIVRYFETATNSSPVDTKVRSTVLAPIAAKAEPQVTVVTAERPRLSGDRVEIPHNLEGFLDP